MGVDEPRQPQSGDPDCAIAAHDEVLGTQIAVDDATIVERGQAIQRAIDEVEQQVLRRCVAVLDPLRQGLPADRLSSNVDLAFLGRAAVEDARDPRRRILDQSPCLDLELGSSDTVEVDLRKEKLDRGCGAARVARLEQQYGALGT